jgi:putative ubiquitin-RnfH superfamily antitoxin RatB of RatAB toxin-antitoxin module
MVKTELVYVTKDRVTVQIRMDLEEGATVAQALIASDIYNLYPETKDLPIGIYAKQVSLDTILRDGDRLELYRLLVLDPKEKRRQLARKVKSNTGD